MINQSVDQAKLILECMIDFTAEFIGNHTPVAFEYDITTVTTDHATKSEYSTILRFIIKDINDYIKIDHFTITYSETDPSFMEYVFKIVLDDFKKNTLKSIKLMQPCCIFFFVNSFIFDCILSL